jgi:hypothetical protein
MHYSFKESKLDQRTHQFKKGDIYVYEGKAYRKHIGIVKRSDNQTICSEYKEFLNPINCRLATIIEIELLKESNKNYLLL